MGKREKGLGLLRQFELLDNRVPKGANKWYFPRVGTALSLLSIAVNHPNTLSRSTELRERMYKLWARRASVASQLQGITSNQLRLHKLPNAVPEHTLLLFFLLSPYFSVFPQPHTLNPEMRWPI